MEYSIKKKLEELCEIESRSYGNMIEKLIKDKYEEVKK